MSILSEVKGRLMEKFFYRGKWHLVEPGDALWDTYIDEKCEYSKPEYHEECERESEDDDD